MLRIASAYGRVASMLLAWVALVGCTMSSSAPAPATAALAFKPMFPLTWPTKPKEQSRIASTKHGEQKEYYAETSIDKPPQGFITLVATCTEFPEQAMIGTTPEKTVEEHLSKFKKHEIKRQPFVIGPQKLPGIDIQSRFEDRFERKMVVMTGRRLYEVLASAPKEEWLALPEVRGFLESFTITE